VNPLGSTITGRADRDSRTKGDKGSVARHRKGCAFPAAQKICPPRRARNAGCSRWSF